MIDFASRSQALSPAQPGADSAPTPDLAWETELFVLQGDDRKHLVQQAQDLAAFLERSPDVDLKDLAATLAQELQPHHCRLAIVAGSVADLHKRLHRAAERLADSRTRFIKDSVGIYWFSEPLYRQGQLVLLFPGEGAQYLNMLADLLPHFPEVRHVFEEADRRQPITPTFLVPPSATAEEKAAIEKQLRSLEYSISSVLLADLALWMLLQQLQVPASAVAGHSAGELMALWAAGCLDSDPMGMQQVVATMASLEKRGSSEPDTLLLAVGAGRPELAGLIRELGVGAGVFLAMDNCPHQCVVVGRFQETSQVESALQARGIVCERLPFHRPYHTPLFEECMGPLRQMFEPAEFHAPRTTMYCCTTGKRFPDDPGAVRDLTLAHWTSPVEFVEMVRSMFADGARIFVETGPRGNLTAFVDDILRGQPVAAIAANVARRSGITQLNHLAGQLIAHEVPLRLLHFHERRQPRTIAWQPAPIAFATAAPTTGRAEVMKRYLEVMDEFLVLQQRVTEQFLASRGRQPPDSHELQIRGLTPPARQSPDSATTDVAPWIMLGQVLHHEPDHALVTRRCLHLDEDLYVHDHALGGSEVSRVDPAQHGSSVLPMTFSLETMAEAAQTLLPHLKVIGVENVRLHRWIPFEDDVPTILEIRAQVLPAAENGSRSCVKATIFDCGHSLDKPQEPRATVEAIVLLAPDYPEPPASEIVLTNERPCRITREFLYHSMFHGALFRGVESTDRLGDREIEGSVRVPGRDNWFRSTTTPALVLDPVLLDMTMHVLASWHLEQPDQAGRILLPFKLDRIEFFGPTAAPGSRVIARGRTDQETARHVRHSIEVLDEQGRMLYRMVGAWYWRFYMPFQGDINFHSPKDEYFLSARWQEADPSPAACCMFLEPPPDLQQSLLQSAMARVTSTPEELRQYFQLPDHAMRRIEWLFTRLAAKDAVRMYWYLTHGRRLMPADLVLDLSESGVATIRPRDLAVKDAYPPTRVARAGSKMVSLASFQGRPGIALAVVSSDAPALAADALDSEELTWLERLGSDRSETLLRFACARKVVAQALAPELPDAGVGVRIRGSDPSTGRVLVTLESALAEAFPEYRQALLRVQTARRQDLIVATTLCEREQP